MSDDPCTHRNVLFLRDFGHSAVPFLKELADRYPTDKDNLDHILIHQLLQRTLEFHRLVNSSGTFFTASEVAAFTTATEGVGKFMLLRHRL